MHRNLSSMEGPGVAQKAPSGCDSDGLPSVAPTDRSREEKAAVSFGVPTEPPASDDDAVAALLLHQRQLWHHLAVWQSRQNHLLDKVVGCAQRPVHCSSTKTFQSQETMSVPLEPPAPPAAQPPRIPSEDLQPPALSPEPDTRNYFLTTSTMELVEDLFDIDMPSASKPRPHPRRHRSHTADFLISRSWQGLHFLLKLYARICTGVRHTFLKLQSPVPDPTTTLGKVVQSHPFELGTIMVILVNSMLIAYNTNYARTHLEDRDEPFVWLEIFFCAFYCVELALRLMAHRANFFLSSDWSWNIFDTVLVFLAVYDLLPLRGMQVVSNFTFLRSVRLLRSLKVLRLVRLMKAFKELRLITQSILKSMRTMLWSMVLVGALFFLAALMFTQGATTFLHENPEVEVYDIDFYWGSLGGAMMSLYLAVSGGNDWELIAAPLIRIGGPYYALFCACIAFYMWVIVNVLTSVFVETTMRSAVVDKQQIIQDQLKNKGRYIKMLVEWFATLDKNKSGAINREEFCAKLNNPAMYAFASAMDIELSDVQEFFDVLTVGGKKHVDLQTFVVGCIRLQGGAKSLDLIDLLLEHRQAVHDNRQFEEFCSQQLVKMRREIRSCSSSLNNLQADFMPWMSLDGQGDPYPSVQVATTSRSGALTTNGWHSDARVGLSL